LRAFVGAGVRPWPRANRSLASRLPRWLSKGTRRASLLKKLEALERCRTAA
jgi:hypothetical protein